ncbi:MAG: hypothetical protein NTW80_02380, partial [Deltaproteobacteria bacterium]|nr:hypothetical protein [Deltaproteobacteria bacterium]
MENRRHAFALPMTITLASLVLLLVLSSPAQAAGEDWPRRFKHDKGTVILYQPQLESFQGDRLTARAAVSVQKKEWKQPVFGVVWLSARALTDRDTRQVTIDEAKVTDTKFPNATPEQIAQFQDFLNGEIEDRSHNISLDRLLAMLDLAEKEKAADAGLQTKAPKIIFTTNPAVLVLLDGEPRLLPLPDSKLMRVANTPFLMVYDPAGKTYFLKGGDTWLKSVEVKGPWQDAGTLPEGLKTLEARMTQGQQAPKKVEASAGALPQIIVSQEPAELIATEGEPQYSPITGTGLLYLSNTESNVFMDTTSQFYYALLSGRWFATKSLQDGPWTYVSPSKLPADFARIPEGSTKGFVLVNVAGTPQAQDAVLENSIPQTAAIDRKKATIKVSYDGEAKFQKIAGTDLEYATNTGQAVFKEGTKYYACDQGVWYEADSANGPWRVSVQPPAQVEAIPPSNPHYNVKYAKVYETTDDVAYVGYTPGYTGSYVQDGTVVYGTGYDYPAYATDATYIPAPATYGYAATYDPYGGSWGSQPAYYNPASWFVPGLVGVAAGVAIGAAASHWWGGHGPYWGGGGWWGAGGYRNVNINNIHNNVINYHPDRRPDRRRPDGRPIVHPVTGPANRPNLYNRPGNRANLAPPRPATRPATQARPGQARPGQTRPGQAVQARPTPAKAARPGQNNVYAGKNGNVYRQTPQGWQERQGNNWSKPAAAAATRPAAAARPTPAARPPVDITRRPQAPSRPATQSGFNAGQLNRESAARQRGETRTQNFQRAQSAPAYRPAA